MHGGVAYNPVGWLLETVTCEDLQHTTDALVYDEEPGVNIGQILNMLWDKVQKL